MRTRRNDFTQPFFPFHNACPDRNQTPLLKNKSQLWKAGEPSVLREGIQHLPEPSLPHQIQRNGKNNLCLKVNRHTAIMKKKKGSCRSETGKYLKIRRTKAWNQTRESDAKANREKSPNNTAGEAAGRTDNTGLCNTCLPPTGGSTGPQPAPAEFTSSLSNKHQLPAWLH